MALALDVNAFDPARRGVERAHLKVIPGALEHPPPSAHVPLHLRNALEGARHELRVRAFLPIHRADTLTKAIVAANHGFLAFATLWPAIVAIVLPWATSDERHLAAVFGGASGEDVWATRRAQLRLGAASCGRWAASEHARTMLARTVLKWPAGRPVPEGLPEDQIVREVMAADFALTFAADAIDTARAPKLAAGFTDWLSEMGLMHARKAYARVAAPLYRDADRRSASSAE